MSDTGWIKLHRKILDCWIWQEKPYDRARAWVDLLLLAVRCETKMLIDNEAVCVERGSYMTSVLKLSERWGWSRNKVKRFLDVLESERMVETKRTVKGTLITIVKYNDFQMLEGGSEPALEPTDEPTVKPKVESEKKNMKKKTKVRNDYFANDEMLNDAFNEFILMRSRIKKPLTTTQAINRMINRLQNLSQGDNDLAVKILRQSVDFCWQDVYELKEEKAENKHQGKSIPIDWDNI